MTLPTGWASDSNYAKDHSPKRGNKVGVAKAAPGTSNMKNHEADIAQAEGNSGMNSGMDVKDAKHNPTPRGNALDTWHRGVTGGHRADGSGSVSKQHVGHVPHVKTETATRKKAYDLNKRSEMGNAETEGGY